MEFGEFILGHDGDDLGQLALARNRYASQVPDFDLALTTLECRRKLRDKVPEWYAVPSLRFPLRVSAEQCSSSATARYKASVASSVGARRIADLTGGLGVDCWAFSQVFDEVLYNEMRPELADAARHNFAALGVGNITVSNEELAPGNVTRVLAGFCPDILFLDPARRASDGRKVFRLEDCQPNVLQLLPELLAACPRLLLKLSPMADISLVCKQLGCVREVHVVCADGECKELLLLLERDYAGEYSVKVYESGTVMEVFGPGLKKSLGPSPHVLASSILESIIDGPGPLDKNRPGPLFLFEPGKGLLKAGAFDLPCQYGLEKLGRHTHLYVGEAVPEELQPFGKVFRVLEALPLNNRNIKAIGKKYPQAEVTARNIPMTSDQLRAKLCVRSGGSLHIFGVQLDASASHWLLVTEK